ncbi:MAG TPA: SCO family protein [Povalibacter sp.]|nr:SCO family protein [Povalibacter sp.]
MNYSITNARRNRGCAVRGPALAVLLLVSMCAMATSDAPALKAGIFDPPRQAPDFTLQGSNATPLRLSSYQGKLVILGFGFTSCANVCPTTLAVLAAARKKLGPAAADVQVVYVTVDPERDDAARMKKYLAAFDPTFVGGTGTAEQLAAVRKNYGIQAEKKVYGNDYSYAHSSYTYLIDRKGTLRALMPFGHSPDDYVHDLQLLLQER